MSVFLIFSIFFMYSLKFGGTSMGSAENIAEVAKIVLSEKKKKSVVVSAMTGVTNQLIEAGQHAKNGEIEKASALLFAIKERHFDALSGLVKKPDIKSFSKTFIAAQIEGLEEFLKAIAVIREISPRSHDEIVSLGEKLSAHLLTVHLRDLGVDSEFVNLENIVDGNLSLVNREFFETVKDALRERILPLVSRGAIPVVTGFFGKIPGGIVGAVGRGYSDFTASLVGYACDSEEIQIWTDVSGILSADPRIVKNAFPLAELSFEEASELANFGAKVIHPQTIWPAVKNNIPVRIKNTMHPEDKGTRITAEGKTSKGAFKSVTAKKGIIALTMHSFEMSGSGFMAKVFNVFAETKISIDLVSTSEASVSVTIEENNQNLEIAVQKLSEFCEVITEKKAILAIIGKEMVGHQGVAGKMFSALGNAGINIRMISQGATEINISAVIDEADVQKGIVAVHDAFFA